MAAAAEDFSGVKIVFDKASYTTGDTMKVTLTGKGVLVLPPRAVMVTLPVIDPTSGGTANITGTVQFTEVDTDSVRASGVPTDDSGLNHVWTLSADGLSATTTA